VQFFSILVLPTLAVKLLSLIKLAHDLDCIQVPYPNMLTLVLAYLIPKILPRAMKREKKKIIMKNMKSFACFY
jgi:hypothetical protein